MTRNRRPWWKRERLPATSIVTVNHLAIETRPGEKISGQDSGYEYRILRGGDVVYSGGWSAGKRSDAVTEALAKIKTMCQPNNPPKDQS